MLTIGSYCRLVLLATALGTAPARAVTFYIANGLPPVAAGTTMVDGTGTLNGGRGAVPTVAPATAPVYLTGLPTQFGTVSHAPAATDTDTHEGVTWGDSLTTDLLDVGDAKVGLKYYGATSGNGVTHGVGFSITIPE